MTIAVSITRSREPLICRVARTLNVALLLGGLVFLMGEGLPTAYSLQTQPVESACFFLMLFGLAVATRHPLDGGLTTLLAWAGFASVTHGHSRPAVLLFLLVALIDVVAGWIHRRSGVKS